MKEIELNSLTLEETKDIMLSLGEKAYRGEQLFSSFNRNKELDIEEINILPQKLRKMLIEKGKVRKINILKKFSSNIDDTRKYLFLLEDGNIIESVLMVYPHGNSICISTQVGCRMGCEFCASTKEGRIRNLTTSEMLNQIYLIEKDLDENIDNIVLMGSGEPLDNYENTLKFLNIIHEPKGHNTSYRNITLSTCGIVPKIYDLANENLPITLSISLHSPFDSEREKMMPIAKTYNIEKLLKASKYYEEITNRRVTFEYTLIEGVNDRCEDINELGKLLKDINSHVNLIPLNPIKEYNRERPELSSVEKFKNKLEKRHIKATVRKEKGTDISASCGQLRRDYIERSQ
ncbi:23S rRNA (adenine(2503)-C(2))-methyltransferase RlmN [Tissierella creatinophila]|uniref:Probable dual-specificity RNA methyltransferase RlmN n=1 Tax=Tissierella creatinophila DSM 6911 TaxID=1123403 RepID=A0A1U7M338_TISCR|nr:23S rRNA (adenine(2503)-C(2))-methyltransferase RlmN [Tissierella creatinophila]OLS01711.1 putative dual-specificity RNA methyltransferase RlmN [Tissierella creatinophila DSM 6911]